MVSGKKQKPAKVVSLPDDRTYRQGFRGSPPEEDRTESRYMERKGEDALKKLRAIGE